MIYVVILIMTFLGALASVFFKKISVIKSIKGILMSRYLYYGCSLYFIASILNIYILKFINYSKLLPLTSFTYIWTMILSFFIFNEKINKLKIAGLFFILIGSILIVY